MNARIAIIRIRGNANIKKEVDDTFKMLRLYSKNTCVIIPNTPSYLGMLRKVKDYVTWGELDKDTFKELLLKRGRLPMGKLDENYVKEKAKCSADQFADDYINFKKELEGIPGLKSFFRLNSPSKGFEREGIKKQYSLGGALGYRKNGINALIRRML
jgi:large subunit ribosomal protein L30